MPTMKNREEPSLVEKVKTYFGKKGSMGSGSLEKAKETLKTRKSALDKQMADAGA